MNITASCGSSREAVLDNNNLEVNYESYQKKQL